MQLARLFAAAVLAAVALSVDAGPQGTYAAEGKTLSRQEVNARNLLAPRFRGQAVMKAKGGFGGAGKDKCNNDGDCSKGKFCNMALKDTECQKGSDSGGFR